MEDSELRAQLERQLHEKRYKHSLGVAGTAKQLAKRFGASQAKAELAGLLHDCARAFQTEDMTKLAEELGLAISVEERFAPILLHAKVGAELATTMYGVADEEIKRAIRLHTTGGAHMTLMDKLIYLADMIEPGRNFPEVGALRMLSERDLDQAMRMAFDQSLHYVLRKNQVIHPDTVIARNEILLKGLF